MAGIPQPGTSDDPTGAGLIVGSAALGFVYGWLMARVWTARMLRVADSV